MLDDVLNTYKNSVQNIISNIYLKLKCCKNILNKLKITILSIFKLVLNAILTIFPHFLKFDFILINVFILIFYSTKV